MAFSACVIGAGPAGIAATLNLRRVGGLVTCFEANAHAGGLWSAVSPNPFNINGNPTPIYPSMRCVIPKDMMAFSDHKFPYLTQHFPHYSAVSEYLQDYATRKGVHSLCRFNTRVERIQWLGDDTTGAADEFLRYSIRGANLGNQGLAERHRKPNKNVWLVRTVNVRTGDVIEWSFDCVVVATGRYHRPRVPDLEADPDASTFSAFPQAVGGQNARRQLMAPIENQRAFMRAGGQVLHNSEVKRFRDYAQKTVVVVGNGIGALELVAELHRHRAFVVHSLVPTSPVLNEAQKKLESAKQAALPKPSAVRITDSNTKLSFFEKLLHKFNPLTDPRFLSNLLRKRNQRKGVSLTDFFAGSAYGRSMSRGGGWQNVSALDPESAEGKAEEAAQTATVSGLLGRYMAVPSVGPVIRFAPPRPDAVKEDESKPKKDVEDTVTVIDPRSRDVDLAVTPGDHKVLTTMLPHLEPDAENDPTSSEGKSTGLFSKSGSKKASSPAGFSFGYGRRNRTVPLMQLLSAAKGRNDAVSRALNSKVELVTVESTDETILRVKGVDAVICCTGYYQEFPFIADPNIRDQVEGASRKPHTRLPTNDEQSAEALEEESKDASRDYLVPCVPARPAYDGLFLGMIYKENPTLAFVGLQPELTPPFLMFEAQAQYIAEIMSRRAALPDGDVAMQIREEEHGTTNEVLANVHGMSIDNCAMYFDALLKECGLHRSHYHYYDQVSTQRKRWWLGTAALSLANKVRSYAPFKRRVYHQIVSNEI